MISRKPLNECADYVTEKIDASFVDEKNYVSTDNMIVIRLLSIV